MGIKKSGGMMYVRNTRRTPKKYICAKCKKELTPQTAYYYVDGCNCAITNNSPPYCKECYKETYK